MNESNRQDRLSKNPKKVQRDKVIDFEGLPNIGKVMARDWRIIGMRSSSQLAGQNLYLRHETLFYRTTEAPVGINFEQEDETLIAPSARCGKRLPCRVPLDFLEQPDRILAYWE